MNLFFYDVHKDYVDYLKARETEARGFTRVPDIEYDNERKMVCGVVLQINSYNYYVPVSSYKIQQPNNILIRLTKDTYNQVKGSLRFNYMFPVPDGCITIRNFSLSSQKRAEFLRRQWVYCNTIESDIKEMAQKTYDEVIKGKNLKLLQSACDFAILESALEEFVKTKVPIKI